MENLDVVLDSEEGVAYENTIQHKKEVEKHLSKEELVRKKRQELAELKKKLAAKK